MLDNDLFEAIKHGELDQCKSLIDQGANLQARNLNLEHKTVADVIEKSHREKMSIEALFYAVSLGDNSRCSELLNDVVNVNTQGKDGWTPLHFAAAYGHLEICSQLLVYGAHTEVKNKDGRTPLMEAASIGRSEVCQILMQHGANIEAVDKKGYTALLQSVIYGHMNVCLALLDHGAQIEVVDLNGRTPLMKAAYHNEPHVCLALISHGACNQGITCKNNQIAEILCLTPLRAAASLGESPLLMKVIHADTDHHTLPERIKEAIALAVQKDKIEAVAVMQSWLAQQAIHDLVKPALSEKVIR